MKKKAVVLVPHQDDELNLIGSIVSSLNAAYDIYVVFSTNGDYELSSHDRRIKETKRVADICGFKKVIFLGYGDCCFEQHLYNSSENEIIQSHAGRVETYGPGEFLDYSYSKNKKHSSYTRANYKKDLTDILLELRGDLLFCVECDSHPDHKALSLLFDEVIKEIAITYDYRPIILKKFAYLGAWHGKNDYFSNNIVEPTLNCFDESWRGTYFSSPYRWNDRIRIKSDTELLNFNFSKSKLFLGLTQYKTQDALIHFGQLANADNCFWYKDIDNLCLSAKISCSSGDNSKSINDLKLVDYSNVTDRECKIDGCAWIPDYNDKSPQIFIELKEYKVIRHIRIHQGLIEKCVTPKAITLYFDGMLYKSFPGNEIVLDYYFDGVIASNIKIEIEKGVGICAIREIEIFDHISKLTPKELGLLEYNEKEKCISIGNNELILKRFRFYLALLKSRGIVNNLKAAKHVFRK